MSHSNNQEIYSLAKQLGLLLLERGAKVSTAESCTGGGIAEAITAVSGSSQWFEYGYITYADSAKQQLLNVAAETLKNCGAVSEQVVREMATGALAASKADYAIAVSGIAGPDGGTGEKPVGTIWICWQGPVEASAKKFLLEGDRYAIREQAVKISLQELLHQLLG